MLTLRSFALALAVSIANGPRVSADEAPEGAHYRPIFYAWLMCAGLLSASFLYVSFQEVAASFGHDYPCVVSKRALVLGGSLACNALVQIDFSIIIPYSFDLASAMGWGAIGSGFLIGIRTALFPMGAAIGRLLCRPWNQIFARRVLLICFIMTGTLQCCSAALLLWRDRVPATQLPWLFFGLRLLASFPIGCINLMIRVMSTKVTTSEEQVDFSVATLSFSNFGLFLGPLVSSLCSSWVRVSTGAMDSTLVLVASATTSILMAFIWAAVACVMCSTLPADLQVLIPKKALADLCDGQEEREQTSYEVRKSIIKCCGTYTLERAFTVGAVEVATTLLLEDKFAWGPEKIGYCYSVVAITTMILGLSYVALQRFVKLNELNVLLAVAICGTLSVGLLFNFQMRFGWQLILADSVIYSCGYVANGITDGLAFRAAMPGPGAMLENWQLGKVWISMLSRSLAAPASRALVSQLGQNAYASVQGCVCMFSLVSIWKLLRLTAKTVGRGLPGKIIQDSAASEPKDTTGLLHHRNSLLLG